MPTTKVFGQLASLAIAGHSKIDGGLTGGVGEATTRIEFVAVDLNGDGEDTSSNEGFMRVWSSNALSGAALIAAARYNAASFNQFTAGGAPSGFFVTDEDATTHLGDNENCGYYEKTTKFTLLSEINDKNTRALKLTDPTARCFLGGDPHLNNVDGLRDVFYPSNAHGQWLPAPGRSESARRRNRSS